MRLYTIHSRHLVTHNIMKNLHRCRYTEDHLSCAQTKHEDQENPVRNLSKTCSIPKQSSDGKPNEDVSKMLKAQFVELAYCFETMQSVHPHSCRPLFVASPAASMLPSSGPKHTCLDRSTKPQYKRLKPKSSERQTVQCPAKWTRKCLKSSFVT